MSFHQKGALKKHSTQTLEQVRTVMFFSSYDRLEYAGLPSNQVRGTPPSRLHSCIDYLTTQPLVIFLELLADSIFM